MRDEWVGLIKHTLVFLSFLFFFSLHFVPFSSFPSCFVADDSGRLVDYATFDGRGLYAPRHRKNTHVPRVYSRGIGIETKRVSRRDKSSILISRVESPFRDRYSFKSAVKAYESSCRECNAVQLMVGPAPVRKLKAGGDATTRIGEYFYL